MNKQIQRQSKNSRKLVKRFHLLPAGIIVAVIILVVVVSTNRYTNKTVSVVFYNIPDTIQYELELRIKKLKSSGITFSTWPAEEKLTKQISKKYGLFFVWKGALADQFAEEAISPDTKLYHALPPSIARAGLYDGQQKMIPLLMDNYEIAFYRTYRNAAGLQIPETLNSFEDYLRTVKKHAEIPLVCAGSNDRTLLGFVSALTESVCGSEGYAALVGNVRETPSVDNVADATLSGSVSFRMVLDKIRSWQQEKLLMPQWYKLKEKDIDMYMKNHLTAAVFMPLSTHRTKQFVLIKYYDAARFPIDKTIANHAIVAPVIEGIMFRNKAGEQDILEQLLSADNQTQLSTKTMLAPVASRAAASDRQSDDVRYWAASCSDGPVAGLYDDAFTDDATAAEFAAQIRDYVKK
ncbi:MAG: hypothetical protein LKF96_09310 [Treponema sp.]|jgi:hypothetical protein|nr:hypothetical protein [Treponema sp.]